MAAKRLSRSGRRLHDPRELTEIINDHADLIDDGGPGGGANLSDATPEDIGTAAAGVSATASRSDHTHGGGLALTATTPSDVGTAAVGVSTTAARADHVHGGGLALSSTTPAAIGTPAIGVGTTAARADHVHGAPGALGSIAPLTVAQTSLIHSNLHGDTEGYEIIGRAYNGTAGTVTFKLQINGSSSNINEWRITSSGSTPAGDAAASMGSLITLGLIDYRIKLPNARRGPTNNMTRTGFLEFMQTYNNGSGTQYFWGMATFTLNDKTNEIVSMGIESASADACGIGSFSRVFAIPY